MGRIERSGCRLDGRARRHLIFRFQMLQHGLCGALAVPFVEVYGCLRVELSVVVRGEDGCAARCQSIFGGEHQLAQEALASRRGIQNLQDQRTTSGGIRLMEGTGAICHASIRSAARCASPSARSASSFAPSA